MTEDFRRGRARMAAGALFFDGDLMLLVNPTYKPDWDIPGGHVEPGESPRAACLREVEEELGIRPPIGALLVVDWVAAPDGDDGRLLFVFDGGTLGDADRAAIRFADGEIGEYRFAGLDELGDYVKASMHRRLTAAFQARAAGRPAYLEHGSIS